MFVPCFPVLLETYRILFKKKNRVQTHNTQTCHFDLTQNLNECEKEYEYTEKNLDLTVKVAL